MWMMPLHLHVNQKSDYELRKRVFYIFCTVQTDQSLQCSHTQSIDLDEGSDQNLYSLLAHMICDLASLGHIGYFVAVSSII